MAKQTFVCDFGDGLTCTTIINDTRAYQGKSHIIGMEWSRRPTRDMLEHLLPRYRDWIHSVNQIVADKTNLTILYALQITPSDSRQKSGGRWEVWAYTSGVKPVLQQVMGDYQ